MEKKQIYSLLTILAVLGIAFGAFMFYFQTAFNETNTDNGYDRQNTSTETMNNTYQNENGQVSGGTDIVGGDKDEHGCIGSAGYQWNEPIGACIRSWELGDAERNAAKVAMQHIGRRYGAAIISVVNTGCETCFTVTVRGEGLEAEVTIQNETVISTY
jgi:hypothetical protein